MLLALRLYAIRPLSYHAIRLFRSWAIGGSKANIVTFCGLGRLGSPKTLMFYFLELTSDTYAQAYTTRTRLKVQDRGMLWSGIDWSGAEQSGEVEWGVVACSGVGGGMEWRGDGVEWKWCGVEWSGEVEKGNGVEWSGLE